MATDEIRGFLRNTTLFAHFNDEQLDVVPKVARERRYEPGEKIVQEGDAGARSFWLILDGEVGVESAGERLNRMGAGEHFGEMALLTGAPRSADVVALTPTTALELAQSHLRGLIHSDPDVGLGIAAELSVRLRRITEQLAAILRASPEAAAVARRLGIETGPEGPGAQIGSIGYAVVVEDT
jgi:CRP-like cAMP-binding protein